VKQTLLAAFSLGLLWLLLSGHLEPLLLFFGVVSVAFVIWLAARMKVIDGESYPFALIPRLFVYWLWLLKEIVKSNLDVARRALGPKSLVAPVVFDARAGQRTELALVIHANSITLPPGTVSLMLEPGTIRVHALHPDVARDAVDSGMDAQVPERERVG
jgi:multicomponent Na+:H+ antiporter subunit E